jgi:hypothetical protein
MTQSSIGRLAVIEHRQGEVDEKIKGLASQLDRLQFWILATFGGVVTSVMLLVVSYVIKQ